MEILTPIALLATIFCGLIAILYLYGRLVRYRYQKSPPVNKERLGEWLLVHGVTLPSVNAVVRECNRLADDITSVQGGVQWRCLRIEEFLPNTSVPEFEILSIKVMNDEQARFTSCVRWPDCVPGLEVSVLLKEEKIKCHLQVDWMLMFAEGTFTRTPEGGVTLSWTQTSPSVSALSCMVTDPPHWKADIDVSQPLLASPNVEASEGVASSVAEGVVKLIQSFKLSNLTIDSSGACYYDNEQTESTESHASEVSENMELMEKQIQPIDDFSIPQNKEAEDSDVEDEHVNGVVVSLVGGVKVSDQSLDETHSSTGEEVLVATLPGKEGPASLPGNEVPAKMLGEEVLVENHQVHVPAVLVSEPVQEVAPGKEVLAVPAGNEVPAVLAGEAVMADNSTWKQVNSNDELATVDKSDQSEDSAKPVSTPAGSIDEGGQEGSDVVIATAVKLVPNGIDHGSMQSTTPPEVPSVQSQHSPLLTSQKWHNLPPMIDEPSIEKPSNSLQREHNNGTVDTNGDNPSKGTEGKVSEESTPSSWRRSFNEEEPLGEDSSGVEPKPLPTYLRVLTYSEEDLTAVDKSPFDRSKTLSIRSYDTDSPMIDASGRFLSTVVFEVEDGGHRKHVVAMNPAHANRLRKQLSKYTKLHIYNDHTFTAKHIKSKHLCAVCNEKIVGLFGKQAYVCRDCDIHTHKKCHHKTEANCPRSQVSTLNLIYPDNIASFSTRR